MSIRRLLVVLVAVVWVSSLASVPDALGSLGVVGALGGPGTGPGEFSTIGGVAVRSSDGDVYVVDTGGDRVEVFSASGAFVSSFGSAGEGAGDFSSPQGVAVEQVTGDVYVTDQGNHRVDEFEPDGAFVRAFGWGVSDGASEAQVCTTVCRAGLSGSGAGELGEQAGYPAVDPVSGDVLLADPSNARVERFQANGSFVGSFGGEGGSVGQFAGGSPVQLGVDGAGYVYAVDSGNARVEKFDSSGTAVAVFASAYASGYPAASGITVEPTLGQILLAKTPAASSGLLREEERNGQHVQVPEELLLSLDTIGDLREASGYENKLPVASGLGAGVNDEDVYYAAPACGCVLILSGVGQPAPSVEIGSASAVGANEATLHGTVNPDEAAPNTLQIIYRLQYSTDEVSWSTAGEGKLAAGTTPVEVTASAMGLQPGVSYHTRLVAEGEYGAASATSTSGSFATATGAPVITGVTVTHMSSNSATVTAEINPGGERTTYGALYGTTAAYGQETVLQAISGSSQTVTVTLSGLQANSEYHFAVKASNAMGGVQASDMIFTTYPASSGALPDGRVYEMVTPPNFHNGELEEPWHYQSGIYYVGSEKPFAASADGSAVAYVGTSSVGGNGLTGTGAGNEYLARRGSQGGWVQTNITPPGNLDGEYQGFTNDLSVGFTEAFAIPPFVASEVPAQPNTEQARQEHYIGLYSRSFSENLFRPLFTVKPLRPNSNPARTFTGEFGSRTRGLFSGGGSSSAVYGGSSADASHLLFSANDDLVEGDGQVEQELKDTVEKEVAELAHVATLKVEKKPAEAEALEEKINNEELYLSVDGTLSVVNVSPEGKLMPDASFGGISPSAGEVSYSNDISADGTKIFWTDMNSRIVYVREDDSRTVQVSQGSAVLWTATADGRYAFYTEAGRLWRFDTESQSRTELPGIGGDLVGVVGVNQTGADGAYVYFVSTEALASGGNDINQQPVGGEDNLYVYEPDPEQPGRSRISFIATLDSEKDSLDWTLGFPYRMSSVTPDGHALMFKSVRKLTSGSYPGEGGEQIYVYDTRDTSLICASCRPQASGGHVAVTESLTHVYRWISEDGDKVFFDSDAPLVSNDINGVEDVYEWERDGSGNCVESDGCVYLLSNGIEGKSEFIDAGASGDDVFFETRAKLVPEDGDEEVNLFDARVGGSRGVSPPLCSGTGCQGPPAQAPIFATPASVTFNGVGNFPPPLPGRVLAKGKVKHAKPGQKLAGALKRCHHDRGRQRKLCETKARKKIGSKRVKATTKGAR